eukprot:CAMPEP_0184873834 /NCGR_PEP_ID=MMETSP0580-20130426/42056_1 /TAXON_ID=1118495 /ORGANISM="Dactyliosolen fragilissimus" /LENGTH=77 /DNA_ID=CAMNT_0027376773 /DNA_START=140 /DNA_END=373 /DNA_ORIENTATION=+
MDGPMELARLYDNDESRVKNRGDRSVVRYDYKELNHKGLVFHQEEVITCKKLTKSSRRKILDKVMNVFKKIAGTIMA